MNPFSYENCSFCTLNVAVCPNFAPFPTKFCPTCHQILSHLPSHFVPLAIKFCSTCHQILSHLPSTRPRIRFTLHSSSTWVDRSHLMFRSKLTISTQRDPNMNLVSRLQVLFQWTTLSSRHIWRGCHLQSACHFSNFYIYRICFFIVCKALSSLIMKNTSP